MKKILFIFLSSLTLISCDPDIPGEGITLPQMEFGFKVFPDTAYIRTGDTLTITTNISNLLENDIRINDGKAVIGTYIGFTEEMPYKNWGMISAKNYDHIELIEITGGVTYNKSGSIGDLIAYLNEDSITLKIGIIPKKKGTYCIQLSSKFFEGSQGKTRTQPYFDMEDCHWDLYQVAEYPGSNPGEEGYNKSYWFAVYE